MDRERIATLTQQVMDLRQELDQEACRAEQAVAAARQAANEALRVAEEARYNYQSAEAAFTAKQQELLAVIEDLKGDPKTM